MALDEVIEGYEGQGEVEERRSATARRIFICDSWDNRKTEAPAFDEAYPGNPFLKVVRRTFEPYGQTTANPASPYTHSKIIIEYSNTALESDGECLEESDFGIDILEVGGGRLWEDGVIIEQPIYIRIPVEWYTLYRTALLVPSGPIGYCIGKVNGYNWQPSNSFRSFAPETVLFEGCRRTVEFDALVGIRTRLAYNFTVRPRSWNLHWYGDAGCWAYTLPLIYEAANFHDMGV